MAFLTPAPRDPKPTSGLHAHICRNNSPVNILFEKARLRNQPQPILTRKSGLKLILTSKTKSGSPPSCLISQHVHEVLLAIPAHGVLSVKTLVWTCCPGWKKPPLYPGNSSWSSWWLLCILQCGYNRVKTRWKQPSNESPLGLIYFSKAGLKCSGTQNSYGAISEPIPPIHIRCWGHIPLYILP